MNWREKCVKFPHFNLEWSSKNDFEFESEHTRLEGKYWWKCFKDVDHEWIASIANRLQHSTGCPFCSGKAVCKSNCLATVNPKLAAEWNYAKNNDLTPQDVTAGSNKRVWWLCEHGHEWKAMINDRNQGRNCPRCNIIRQYKDIVEGLPKYHWSRILAHAKEREKELDITPEEILQIYKSQNGKCAISGLPITFRSEYGCRKTGRKYSLDTASLDRIDSSKGYVHGNVQWVHKHINVMKSYHDQNYFLSLVESIYNHSIKRT
jgi:hypothetical protein